MKQLILLVSFGLITVSGFSQCNCGSGGLNLSNSVNEIGMVSDTGLIRFNLGYFYRSLKLINPPAENGIQYSSENIGMQRVVLSTTIQIGKRMSINALLPYSIIRYRNTISGFTDLPVTLNRIMVSKEKLKVILRLGAKFSFADKPISENEINFLRDNGAIEPLLGFDLVKNWKSISLITSNMFKVGLEGIAKYNSGNTLNNSIYINISVMSNLCTNRRFNYAVLIGVINEYNSIHLKGSQYVKGTGMQIVSAEMGITFYNSLYNGKFLIGIPIYQKWNNKELKQVIRFGLHISKQFFKKNNL